MKKQIRRLNALVWGLLGLFIVAMPVTSWAQSSQVVETSSSASTAILLNGASTLLIGAGLIFVGLAQIRLKKRIERLEARERT